MNTFISTIICSPDRAKFVKSAAHFSELLGDDSHEVIRIHDATGLAEGYNRGVTASRGDLLIFSHDDVRFLAPDFRRRLLTHMEHCDLLGIAGTTMLVSGRWTDAGPPYLYGQVAIPNPQGLIDVEFWGTPDRRVDGIQAVDGAFMCCRREAALQVGFDRETFGGFHLYDLDFSLRVFLGGFRLAVCNDLDAMHFSKGDYSSPQWSQDAAKFVQKHDRHLGKSPVRHIRTAGVAVTDLAAVRKVMRPPHWAAE